MRECGLPAYSLIGLECCGWGGTESSSAGEYVVEDAGHVFFRHPEATGLQNGESFGSGGGKSRKAVGHEYDVRVRTLARMTRSIPPGASIPEEPAGIATLAFGRRPGKEGALDYFTNPAQPVEGVVAEMIYWERPQGGRVFNAGAIGAGWSLGADPKLSRLMRNVLHHFGVASPERRSQ